MKNLLIPIFLLISMATVNASQIVTPTIYQQNGTVTSANLNGNFTAVNQVVNGGLDNTNANTTSGYRFFQTVGSLPSPGNQGSVYFLTSDNTLNFDTGSSFIKSVAISGTPSQGDVIYYGSTGWVNLSAGTAGQSLITKGAGANPQWQTVVPIGGIIIWSGSVISIPSNYHLCDGTSGTPNLQDKFVIGAGNTYAVNATGGSTTITTGNLPASALTVSGSTSNGSGNTTVQFTTNGGSLTTMNTSNLGSGTAYLQPYFALCYIQRIS